MHELSIASSIRTSIEQLAEKYGESKVLALVLEIGELSGIEINSLLFLWDECMRGSILEHADIKIIRPEGKGKCKQCQMIFPMTTLYTSCPKCQSVQKEIIQGQALKIKSISFTKK